MEVREHRSQHEAVEEMPLITESAVVTDVSAMDRNRTDEVLVAIRQTLDATEQTSGDATVRRRTKRVPTG